jgi:hypothetical protein
MGKKKGGKKASKSSKKTSKVPPPKKKIIVKKTDGKWYEIEVGGGKTHPPEWYEQHGWLRVKDDDTTGNQLMLDVIRRIELESLLPDYEDL